MKHIAIATLLLGFVPVMPGQTNAPTAPVSNPVVSTVRQLEERQIGLDVTERAAPVLLADELAETWDP